MPKMRWDPVTGENQTFTDDESAPEGWLDHHPLDPAHKAGPTPAPEPEPVVPVAAPDAPLTKKELVAALTEGGIVFDKGAEAADLDAVLRDALTAALTAAKVDFELKASTRELLAFARNQ